MHFEGLNTKIRVLHGMLLTQKDYTALCERTLPIPTERSISSFLREYTRIRAFIYDITCREYMDALIYKDKPVIEYYIRLWKAVKTLPGKENRRVMAHLTGTEIEGVNAIRSYRLQRHYKLTGLHVYAYLIPVGYRVKKNGATLLNNVTNSDYPERDAKRLLKRLYMRNAKKHPDTLAVSAAYLFCKRLEIDNILKINEGLRYNLPVKEIMEYII
jgi:vacuolar-type H+-ATPase subunit C/Vma6